MSLLLCHFLYGIAERGAVHLMGMVVEIAFKSGHVAFAHLAQHPPHGLVYQVVGMMHKYCGEMQAVVVLVGTNQHLASHHGYAQFP